MIEKVFITISPEQYRQSRITSSKRYSVYISEEGIGELSEYEGVIVIFDDKLEYNQKEINQFFTVLKEDLKN